MNDERNQLLAELTYLNRTLENLPRTSVIDRLSIESRKKQVEESLSFLNSNLYKQKMKDQTQYSKMRQQIVWIITDTHFNHDKMLTGGLRPPGFEKLITRNLARLVAEQDVLIHLGDVIIRDYSQLPEYMSKVKGRKILTMGNHDRQTHSWYSRHGFDIVCESFQLGNIVFSHEPILNFPDYAQHNIHGHFHRVIKNLDDMYDRDRIRYPWYNLNRHHALCLEHENYRPVNLLEWCVKNNIQYRNVSGKKKKRLVRGLIDKEAGD